MDKGGRLPTTRELKLIIDSNKGEAIFPIKDLWAPVLNNDEKKDYI